MMNLINSRQLKRLKVKWHLLLLIIINDNIFDINDFKKSIDLEQYFKRYSKQERDKFKHISTNFYSVYIFLAKKLFKNASILIYRFYIVIQDYNALNSTKISFWYKSNPNYNKLKD